jgi:hypothetical protein
MIIYFWTFRNFVKGTFSSSLVPFSCYLLITLDASQDLGFWDYRAIEVHPCSIGFYHPSFLGRKLVGSKAFRGFSGDLL